MRDASGWIARCCRPATRVRAGSGDERNDGACARGQVARAGGGHASGDDPGRRLPDACRGRAGAEAPDGTEVPRAGGACRAVFPRARRSLSDTGVGGAGVEEAEGRPLRDHHRRRGARAVSRATETPLMQQYREIKGRHQDAILFFRMGDFYEMFYEDAEIASRLLGLTLTARNNGGAAEVPLAGVPVKAVSEYLRRLVQQGHKVAICEQVEDPALAKGIVRREVVETITPGAAFADDLLDRGRNNYLCAVRQNGAGERAMAGVAAADVSTGELRLFVVPLAALEPVLARLAPRELLLARRSDAAESSVPNVDGALLTEREGWEFDAAMARDELTRHFAVHSLDGLGIGAGDDVAVGAAGALLRYLRELQPGGVPHLARPTIEREGGVMALDEMTRRNLELVESLRGGGTAGTLLDVVDRTMTPMGARMLRQWLLAPLTT